MAKVAFTVNGAEPCNLYPAFTLAASTIASGDDVIMFFTPCGAPGLVKGVMEEMKVKGLPDLIDLVDGVMMLGGRMMLCELAFEAKDIYPASIRGDVEVVGATTFVVEAQDARIAYSF